MTPNQTLVAFGNVLKKITLSLFLVVACNAFAQVGVGTQTPATTLDVVGAAGTTPGALNTIDGIAVPVVTDDMTTTTTAGSRISQLVYSNNAASTGYYFWNGTAWAAMSGGGGPDFTVGTGGELTITLDGTNLDFSANTANNSFNVTTTQGFGTDFITLPAPETNVGRIILIKNNGPKSLGMTNSFSVTAVLTTRAAGFISDGVHWVNTSN